MHSYLGAGLVWQISPTPCISPDLTIWFLSSSKRIVIKTMSWLHHQGNVSNQFDSVKTNFLGLHLGPTNVGILGRDL